MSIQVGNGAACKASEQTAQGSALGTSQTPIHALKGQKHC